jgi:hypothetical protein
LSPAQQTGSAAMKMNSYSERGLWRANPSWDGTNRSSSATTEAALEFGRCRVLLRRRQLLADGAPVELGSAPSIYFWSSWRPTARSSQKRSS